MSLKFPCFLVLVPYFWRKVQFRPWWVALIFCDRKVLTSEQRLRVGFSNWKTSFKIMGAISFLTLNISVASGWRFLRRTATELPLLNSSSKAVLLSLHTSFEDSSCILLIRVSCRETSRLFKLGCHKHFHKAFSFIKTHVTCCPG